MTERRRSSIRTVPVLVVACLALGSERGLAAEAGATTTTAGHRTMQRRLDLKIGDIRRYVDPGLLETPVPDELEEIIVNGQRPEPLPEQRVLPQGLGSLLYAVQRPLQAWRIFIPDPNLVIPERTADDAREPPGAFRARILQPGAIYD